jgi:hypothetical protein
VSNDKVDPEAIPASPKVTEDGLIILDNFKPR